MEVSKPYIVIDDFNYRFCVHALSLGDDLLTKVSTAEGHVLSVDEPRAVGWLGRAPNPIEMFLTALASCFIITLKLHAKRLGLVIDHVEVFSEGSFDIRGFIMPEKFTSGFKSLSLKASISTGVNCEKLRKLLNKVFNGWIVGSTVSRAVPISIDIRARCLDVDGSPKELIISEVVSKSY